MPLIMNASAKPQSIRVHGDWFTFTPGQIKIMNEDKVSFLAQNGGIYGFVTLPDSIEDLDFRNSKEGQEIIKQAKEAGIRKRVAYLEQLKHNELVSLQKDITKSGQNYDPRAEMSPQMLEHFEELVSYKQKNQDEAQKRIDRVKELEAALKD